MDTSSQTKLLNALHSSITNLPQLLTAKGITSQQDINAIVDNFKKQIGDIAINSYTFNDAQSKTIQSLQSEIDFIKKVYLSKFKNDSVNITKYKNLYDQTLEELTRATIKYNDLKENSKSNDDEHLLKTKIAEYEEIISTLSGEIELQEIKNNEVVRGATLYKHKLTSLFRIIYPNENTENIDEITEKLSSYIQNTSEQNKMINNLNNIIAELRARLQQQHSEESEKIKRIADRCSEKLTNARNVLLTFGNRDITFPKELEVDLVAELSASMNEDGTFEPILYTPPGSIMNNDDQSNDDYMYDDDDFGSQDLIDTTSVPPTPGRDLDISNLDMSTVGLAYRKSKKNKQSNVGATSQKKKKRN